MSNDLLAQVLLGQMGQRGQRSDPRAALAARLMAGSPPAAPITNAGAGLAYALTQGLDAWTGARLGRQAEEADAQRQNDLFKRVGAFQRDRAEQDVAALEGARAAARGVPAQPPAIESPLDPPRGPAPPPQGGDPRALNDQAAAERDAVMNDPSLSPDEQGRRLAEISARRSTAAGLPPIPGGYRANPGVEGVFNGVPPPSGRVPPVPVQRAPPAPDRVTQAEIEAVGNLAAAGNAAAAARLPLMRAQLERQEREARDARQMAERRDERADERAWREEQARLAREAREEQLRLSREDRTSREGEARAAREAEAERARLWREEQARIARENRPLPERARADLGETGGTVGTLSRLGATFRDEFGGQPMVGNAVNFIGRTTGLGGDQSQWWQDYQNHKNVIRNRLFGSALTATEAREFERASIEPGMAPSQIRQNLARQQAAAQSAALRLGRSLLADGHRPEAVAEALGMPIETLRNERLLEQAEPLATPAPAARTEAPAQRGAPMPGSMITGREALERARAELGTGATDEQLVARAREIRAGGGR